MKIIVFLSVLLVFTSNSVSAKPKYKKDPIEVELSGIAQYWIPKKTITNRNTKVVASPSIGCKSVVVEGNGKTSELWVDLRFTIDSKGKMYDQEILSISNLLNKELIEWAKTFGLSPTYKFKAINKKDKQPILSKKRLYFVDNTKLCKGISSDIALYSNQTITITDKDIK